MVSTGIRHAARELDLIELRVEVAMAKVYTATVTNEIVDLAVQCCGANGIATDLPLWHFYRSVREFRIVDGADEVHRRTIARERFDSVDLGELEPVLTFDERLRSTSTE
jgi:acyl-CoA dehydrogenase